MKSFFKTATANRIVALVMLLAAPITAWADGPITTPVFDAACTFETECVDQDCAATTYTATAVLGFTGVLEGFGFAYSDDSGDVFMDATLPSPTARNGLTGVYQSEDRSMMLSILEPDLRNPAADAPVLLAIHDLTSQLSLTYYGRCTLTPKERQ